VTGWTVWGLNPGEEEVLRTRPELPWGPLSLLYNGYRFFLKVKRLKRGVDHPTTHSAEGKETIELGSVSSTLGV